MQAFVQGVYEHERGSHAEQHVSEHIVPRQGLLVARQASIGMPFDAMLDMQALCVAHDWQQLTDKDVKECEAWELRLSSYQLCFCQILCNCMQCGYTSSQIAIAMHLVPDSLQLHLNPGLPFTLLADKLLFRHDENMPVYL